MFHKLIPDGKRSQLISLIQVYIYLIFSHERIGNKILGRIRIRLSRLLDVYVLIKKIRYNPQIKTCDYIALICKIMGR